MAERVDLGCPDDGVVLDEVVAAAARVGPDRPVGWPIQGYRLSVEIDVPPARVQREDGEVAASTWAAQVDGAVLVADPELARAYLMRCGQQVYEDGSEFQGRSVLGVRTP